MQKIKPLLAQASNGLRKNSSASPTAAGQTSENGSLADSSGSPARVGEPEPGFEDGQALDHVDAINQVFAEFEFAYHNQFHKAFASEESLVIAKKYWLSSLEQFTPRQIVQAAKRVIRNNEYLPSIAVILKACEQGFDLFGLPSPRQAYVEACAAPPPKRDFDWSHDAVYCAGRAAGWYLLATEPEAVAFPVFEYHYRVLCERVMNGEELEREAPPALTDRVARPLSREEARARLARLRKELKL